MLPWQRPHPLGQGRARGGGRCEVTGPSSRPLMTSQFPVTSQPRPARGLAVPLPQALPPSGITVTLQTPPLKRPPFIGLLWWGRGPQGAGPCGGAELPGSEASPSSPWAAAKRLRGAEPSVMRVERSPRPCSSFT